MTQFIFVLSCLFIVAAATQLLGLDSIVGAFIAGLALNSLIPLSRSLMEHIEFVGNSLFIPAFMISVGVLCNPRVLVTHPENLGVAIAVITGAVGAKFLASWIAGQVFKYPFADVMVMFGLTMSRAGLVLVIALFAQQASLITEGLFNAIMLYVIVTCLSGPLVCDAYGKQIASESYTVIQISPD
jgi:Kef-type K+ transport system membrane component KefB